MHPTFELSIPSSKQMTIAFTEATHCHVAGSITVRGIEYNIGVHLFEHADKHFRLGREGQTPFELYQQLHVYRAGFKDISDAARKSIREQVEIAANNFIEKNREILVMAEGEKLRSEMERAEHEYAEAMELADKARVVRDAAQKKFMDYYYQQVQGVKS